MGMERGGILLLDVIARGSDTVRVTRGGSEGWRSGLGADGDE